MSTEEAEVKARSMGWEPLEDFVKRGRPEDRWVDAETYVERGEQILPILKANNKKLLSEVSEVKRQNQELSAKLSEASEAIEALKDLRTTLNVDRVKAQKAQIIEDLKQAKQEGDIDSELQLTDKLTEANAALKEAAKTPVVKPAVPPPPAIPPAAQEWMSRNPWFGNGAEHDAGRTGYAMGLAKAWVASGKAAGTEEFFAHVDEKMAEVFDPNAGRRQRPSKVDESTSSGDTGGGGDSKRTFAALPREVREAFERQAKHLVGPNKTYKTKADLQKIYVEQYDWS